MDEIKKYNSDSDEGSESCSADKSDQSQDQ
jgi:hypothetical protein